jgi:hypothetical protein
MKHWKIVTILLATFLLAGLVGCNEVEQREPIEGQRVEQKKAPPKCNSGRCYPGEKANSKLFNYKISENQVQEDPEAQVAPETSVDEPARREIMRNRAQILKMMKHLEKHCKAIQELCDRTRASVEGSQGIEIRPVPVPIIPVPPDAISPRLPKTRINKSKKFTSAVLLGPFDPVPLPKPGLPYPRPIPC